MKWVMLSVIGVFLVASCKDSSSPRYYSPGEPPSPATFQEGEAIAAVKEQLKTCDPIKVKDMQDRGIFQEEYDEFGGWQVTMFFDKDGNDFASFDEAVNHWYVAEDPKFVDAPLLNY